MEAKLLKYRGEIENLRGELQVCRRKLDSKCEALLILSKELDQARRERDQLRLIAEQYRHRHGGASKFNPLPLSPVRSMSCEVTSTMQVEIDDLRQKLKDANGDIKLLREQIARQRVGTTDEGMNTRHFPAHEREELVTKLEAMQEKVLQSERDLQQVLDEKEELVTEREVYKTKYDRLNQELNYILKGDEKRVVDIDALVMENKYLQERLKQMEEEKSAAMATVSKYKSLLERRKNKGILKTGGQTQKPGVVVSQKQVQELLKNSSNMAPSPQAMSDLQALARGLLETINDKNLALSHQRKTNKILGNRVSELEKKLKTLEVSGLWSVTGLTPDKLRLPSLFEGSGETLIPSQYEGESCVDISSSDKPVDEAVKEMYMAALQGLGNKISEEGSTQNGAENINGAAVINGDLDCSSPSQFESEESASLAMSEISSCHSSPAHCVQKQDCASSEIGDCDLDCSQKSDCADESVEDDDELCKEDAPLLQHDPSLLQHNPSVLQHGAPLLQQDVPLVQQDATLLEQNAPHLQQDAPLLQQGAPLLQHDTLLVQNNAPLLQHDGPLLQHDAPLLQHDAPLVPDEQLLQFENENKIQTNENACYLDHVTDLIDTETSKELETDTADQGGENDEENDNEQTPLVKKDNMGSLENLDSVLNDAEESDSNLSEENLCISPASSVGNQDMQQLSDELHGLIEAIKSNVHPKKPNEVAMQQAAMVAIETKQLDVENETSELLQDNVISHVDSEPSKC